MSSYTKGRDFEIEVCKTITKYGSNEERNRIGPWWDRTPLHHFANNFKLTIGGRVKQEEDIIALYNKGTSNSKNIYIQCKHYNKKIKANLALNELSKTGSASKIIPSLLNHLMEPVQKEDVKHVIGTNKISFDRMLEVKDVDGIECLLEDCYPNIIPSQQSKISFNFGQIVTTEKNGELILGVYTKFSNKKVFDNIIDFLKILSPVGHYILVASKDITPSTNTLFENFDANFMTYKEFKNNLEKGELIDSLSKFNNFKDYSDPSISFRAFNACCNLAERGINKAIKKGEYKFKNREEIIHHKRRMSKQFLKI